MLKLIFLYLFLPTLILADNIHERLKLQNVVRHVNSMNQIDFEQLNKITSEFDHFNFLIESIKSLQQQQFQQEQVNSATNSTTIPTTPPSMNFTNFENITIECGEDLLLILTAYSNPSLAPQGFSSVLSQLMDAQGKIPPGFSRGAQHIYGFKQECDIIKYRIPHSNREFRTSYGRVFLDSNVLLGGNKTCDPTSPMLSIDICTPKSCSKDDLNILFMNFNVLDLIDPSLAGSENPLCSIATMDSIKSNYDYRSYITLTVFFIILIIAGLATIVDYFIISPDDSKRSTKPLNLFLAFSLYTNISEILTVKKSNLKGQITCIHFIRGLSMVWVIVAHTFMVFGLSSNNYFDFIKTFDYPLLQIIMNGFYSVDNFFFIGALLLSFLFFKELERNRKRVMSIHGWIMFYLHRYIRLSPSYFMAIAVSTYLYYEWISNKIYYLTTPILDSEDVCKKYFWYNILYINNVDVQKSCFPHAWYLAADMQMYVASPVVLVSLAVNPIIGVVVSLLLLAFSTAGNIVTVYINHYPPTGLGLGIPDPELQNFDKYDELIYYAMWIRCQIYILGLLAGYLLQKKKKLQIPTVVQILGWPLIIAMMCAIQFGLYDYMRGEVAIPLFWRAMYSSLSRIGWGIGLSWIIMMCYYGCRIPVLLAMLIIA